MSFTARDALHIAVLERHGVSRVMSFDADFDRRPGADANLVVEVSTHRIAFHVTRATLIRGESDTLYADDLLRTAGIRALEQGTSVNAVVHQYLPDDLCRSADSPSDARQGVPRFCRHARAVEWA